CAPMSESNATAAVTATRAVTTPTTRSLRIVVVPTDVQPEDVGRDLTEAVIEVRRVEEHVARLAHDCHARVGDAPTARALLSRVHCCATCEHVPRVDGLLVQLHGRIAVPSQVHVVTPAFDQ